MRLDGPLACIIEVTVSTQENKQMAGAPGFEPGMPSSEGWCLIHTRLRAHPRLSCYVLKRFYE